MNDRVSENIRLSMPWQLQEYLHKARVAGAASRIAEIGFMALAFEQITQFDDKAEEYAKVWQDAYVVLGSIAGQPK